MKQQCLGLQQYDRGRSKLEREICLKVVNEESWNPPTKGDFILSLAVHKQFITQKLLTWTRTVKLTWKTWKKNHTCFNGYIKKVKMGSIMTKSTSHLTNSLRHITLLTRNCYMDQAKIKSFHTFCKLYCHEVSVIITILRFTSMISPQKMVLQITCHLNQHGWREQKAKSTV